MGAFLTVNDVKFSAGGDFPRPWIRRHINAKEASAVYNLLRAYCIAHPDTLRGTQIRGDVDNRCVDLAFNYGRSRNAYIHELLVSQFQLQAREGFWLRLRWVPTQENTDADPVTRLGVEEFVRFASPSVSTGEAALRAISVLLNGYSTVSATSARRVPASGTAPSVLCPICVSGSARHR